MKKIVFLLLLAVTLLLSSCAVYDNGYGYGVVVPAPGPAVVVYSGGYHRPYYRPRHYPPPPPPHRYGSYRRY